MTLSILLAEHRALLCGLEARLAGIRSRYGSLMRCAPGCDRCCHGLFDVPLADAVRVARAHGALPEAVRASVAGRAALLQRRLLERAPCLRPPFFLSSLSEEEIDRLVEALTGAACPFLDGEGLCLIYDQRPLACLLEGIPMVDASDGLFGDWCELNFRDGVSAGMERALALDYYAIQATQDALSAALAQCVPCGGGQGGTVFIPSIVAAWESHWAWVAARPADRGKGGSTGGWRP